jgi:hypothetical protein
MSRKRAADAHTGPTLRVLIAETPPDYTIDGTDVGALRVGGEYDLPANIAEVLLALQIAVMPLGQGLPVQPPASRSIQ